MGDLTAFEVRAWSISCHAGVLHDKYLSPHGRRGCQQQSLSPSDLRCGCSWPTSARPVHVRGQLMSTQPGPPASLLPLGLRPGLRAGRGGGRALSEPCITRPALASGGQGGPVVRVAGPRGRGGVGGRAGRGTAGLSRPRLPSPPCPSEGGGHFKVRLPRERRRRRREGIARLPPG